MAFAHRPIEDGWYDYGTVGGEGMPECNRLNGEPLAPKTACEVASGERLTIETPGGGGWGQP